MDELQIQSELIDRRIDLVRAIVRRDPSWRWIAAEVAHLAAQLEARRSQLRFAADGDVMALERVVGL